ncbi:MAG: HmuY family protein [Gaiellales bacterium]
MPGILLLAVVGVFLWGHFQPKPPGFAPTDPDTGALVTDDWVQYTVDATDRRGWVFFDFERGRVVEATFEDDGWDVAFKRTGIRTNSGVTHPAGPGGSVDLGEVDLESATPPSETRFAVDELGGDDGDEPRNPAISGWYRYNFLRHVVLTRANTYLVRTGGPRDALVRFDSYYCDDESAGCITMRYRLVPAVASLDAAG